MKQFLIYIVIVSAAAFFMTLADKLIAKKNGSGDFATMTRIPEIQLFAVALIGGAAAELITMLVIRHKTRHMRFMVGLPLIIILHAALAVLYFVFFYKGAVG